MDLVMGWELTEKGYWAGGGGGGGGGAQGWGGCLQREVGGMG